jgi:ADP-heptose:LPS heptosyltransferase
MDWCTPLLQSSMRILITGGAGFIGRHIVEYFHDRAEVRVLDNLANEIGSDRVIPLAGKTTLRQVLALYTRSEILVTNDSGPAHFASMTPIHVVTLFGPETPALFAARSPNAIALWAGIACSPCVNAYNNRQSVCRNNLCMQAITVDDVFKEVTGIYDSLKTDHIRKLICRTMAVPTHRIPGFSPVRLEAQCEGRHPLSTLRATTRPVRANH